MIIAPSRDRPTISHVSPCRKVCVELPCERPPDQFQLRLDVGSVPHVGERLHLFTIDEEATPPEIAPLHSLSFGDVVVHDGPRLVEEPLDREKCRRKSHAEVQIVEVDRVEVLRSSRMHHDGPTYLPR